jgi:hypothetical protein
LISSAAVHEAAELRTVAGEIEDAEPPLEDDPLAGFKND